MSIASVASRQAADARRLARGITRIARGAAVLATADPARAAGEATVVLLAVGDRDVASLARLLAAGRVPGPGHVALHLSGALPVETLAPLRQAGWSVGSLHPFMTFSGGRDDASRCRGAAYAVDGDARARAVAARLVRALGGRALRIRPGQRAAYHLAACLSSNYLQVLIEQALRELARAGVARNDARRALAPILAAGARNALEAGPAALTGPAARGDAGTIRAHVRSLRREPAAVRALHESLVVAAVSLARESGLLRPADAGRVLSALRDRR